MLLPNCICQFLQPFGVEIFHDEAEPRQVQAQEDRPALPEDLKFGNTPSGFFSAMPCHCDESCNKFSDNASSDDEFRGFERLAERAPLMSQPQLMAKLPVSIEGLMQPLSRCNVQAELCIFVI
jgi:hypothetical protein